MTTWVAVKQVAADLGAGLQSPAYGMGNAGAKCQQPLCTPIGPANAGCDGVGLRCAVQRHVHLAGPRVALVDGIRTWQVPLTEVWRIARALNVPLPEQYPVGADEPPQPIPVPPPAPGTLPPVPGPSTPLGAPLAYPPGKSPRQLANVATALRPIAR